MNTIGERLKLLRGKTKQPEVEQATGIKYYNLSNYENDSAQLPLSALLTLAEYYKVTTDYILLGRDSGLNSREYKDLLNDNRITFDGEVLTDDEKEILMDLSKIIKTIRKQKEPR